MILFAILHNSSLNNLIYHNNFYDVDQTKRINIQEIQRVAKFPKSCRGQCENCLNNSFTLLDISINFLSENLIEKLSLVLTPFQMLNKINLKNCYVSEQFNANCNQTQGFRFLYCLESTSQENQILNQKLPYSLYLKIIEIFEKNKKLDLIF
jgi:hypothetical protein